MNLEEYLEELVNELCHTTPNSIKIEIGTQLGMFHINSRTFVENFVVNSISGLDDILNRRKVTSLNEGHLLSTFLTETEMDNFSWRVISNEQDEYLLFCSTAALMNFIIEPNQFEGNDFINYLLNEIISVYGI